MASPAAERPDTPDTPDTPAAPRLTAANAKRLIGVAKVVAPVVLPFAMNAAGYLRHRYDVVRARRLGVPVGQVGEFTGKGASLHARLAMLADVLVDVALQDDFDQPVRRWAKRSERRLGDLAAAVRVSERMPAGRRKAAHHAVANELDTIEATLLTHLRV